MDIREIADKLATMQLPVRWLQLDVAHAEPRKVTDGMLVIADGTDWDPGSGVGPYYYLSSAWVFCGGGGGGGPVSWASITSKPTTVSGFGITDAVTTARTISTTSPLSGGGALSGNLTLAVSTFGSGASGVVPASGGGTSNFLRADGSWAAPSGGASWTETEIDFGSNPVYTAHFTVTDAGISGTSKVQVLPCGKAATGRTADDWEWDGATFAANPSSGSMTCYAVFSPGPIVGKRKIQYAVA